MGGGTVDIDLFAAHCTSLVACIQLHERFGDPTDDNNPSNIRILASARALLGFVHRLSSTFDLTIVRAKSSERHRTLQNVMLIGAAWPTRQRSCTLSRRSLGSQPPVSPSDG